MSLGFWSPRISIEPVDYIAYDRDVDMNRVIVISWLLIASSQMASEKWLIHIKKDNGVHAVSFGFWLPKTLKNPKEYGIQNVRKINLKKSYVRLVMGVSLKVN